MNFSKVMSSVALCMVLAFGLVACGSGGGGGHKKGTATFTIGGTVSGLLGSNLVLRHNISDDLVVNTNGSFVFNTTAAKGEAYVVEVLSQPTGPVQTCTVNNGTGTIKGSDVTDVTVICAGQAYTVGGTATGITNTVVLQNNGGDNLTLTGDNPFTFSTPVANTAGYDVTVLSSSGLGCSLTNATGTVSGADVTDVSLSCIPVTVSALYPTHGANWNDYVSDNGSDEFTATDTTCDPDIDTSCLHGGELRVVEVPDESSCADVTMSEALGVFNWTCDDSSGTVRFISTSLKDGKNLSDLLDFTTPGWKKESVTVTVAAGSFMTTPAAWWANPMVEDNDGGYLNTAGTIYVVTNDALTPSTGGYIINASSIGLVGQPGVIINGPGTAGNVIYVNGFTIAKDFLWIEGDIDASGGGTGVYLDTVRFSKLNNLKSDSATGSGISFYNSSNNLLKDVTASMNGFYGISLDYFSNNILSYITASYNSKDGVYIRNAVNNKFSQVSASHNENDGVDLFLASNNNILNGLTASNNGYAGVEIYSSNSNELSDIIVSNNTSDGIYLYFSSNNTIKNATASSSNQGVLLSNGSNKNKLVGITASNGVYGVLISSKNNLLSGITTSDNSIGIFLGGADNTLSGVTVANSIIGVWLNLATNNALKDFTVANSYQNGIWLKESTDNTLSSVTAVNTSNEGVYLDNSSNNSLSGLTVTNNGTYGVYLINSSDNYFTELLEVGNNSLADCLVSGGTDPGLVNTTCTTSGLYNSSSYGFGNISDATLYNGVSLDASFVGRIYNDTSNSSDTGSAVLYPTDTSAFDWSTFDNHYRVWGLNGIFNDISSQGRWTSGYGTIWDWSLSGSDTVIRDVLALPTGYDTLIHTWSNSSTTTFLRNAVEISGDGIGNDNLLCESGETCLYTPNIGSYQGHGNLVSAGSIGTGGTLENITLLQYETNGR